MNSFEGMPGQKKVEQAKVSCPQCSGTGKKDGEKCKRCNGSGKIAVN